jgi:hypothetical protein
MDFSLLTLLLHFTLGSFNLDLTALIVLVIIALAIIIVIKLFLALIPAAIVAVVVYLLTNGDLFWTGIAFLIVAALSLISKL